MPAAPHRAPGLPDPDTPALAGAFYPGAFDIVAAACEMVQGRTPPRPAADPRAHLDVPDPSFTGPF